MSGTIIVTRQDFGISGGAEWNPTLKQWEGDDETAKVQQAINETPLRGELDLGGLRIMAAGLVQNRAIDIKNAVLTAPAGHDGGEYGALLTQTRRGAPTGHHWGNHLSWANTSNLHLDGNARKSNCVGLRMDLVQHSVLNQMRVQSFSRQGIWGRESVREMVMFFPMVRYCGSEADDLPGFDMMHCAGTDGHNNVTVFHGEAVYNFHTQVRVGCKDISATSRNFRWFGGLLHGNTKGATSADQNVRYAGEDDLKNNRLLEVMNARGVSFVGVQFNDPGDSECVYVGAVAGAEVEVMTVNSLTVADSSFRKSGKGPWIRNDQGTITLTGNNGSIDRYGGHIENNSSQPHHVQSTGNTWDAEHTHAACRTTKAETLTLHAHDTGDWFRLIATTPTTIVVPDEEIAPKDPAKPTTQEVDRTRFARLEKPFTATLQMIRKTNYFVDVEPGGKVKFEGHKPNNIAGPGTIHLTRTGVNRWHINVTA